MRLLIVVNYAEFFLSHRLGVALEARRRGFDVHIAGQDGPRVPEVRANGLPFHVLPRMRGPGSPLREAGTVIALTRLYRRVRPDLVHHVSIKPVLYGTLAARAARVPAVVNAISGLGSVFVASGPSARLRRSLVEAGYALALRHPRMRTIVQNTDDWTFLAKVARQPEETLRLIAGSGVDVNLFRPVPEARVGPALVVLPARMLGDKGVREFVAAARLLRADGHHARFALVGGTDPDNPSAVLEAEIRDWVAEGAVEWWGHRDDMVDVYAAAHVVCLPSYREGLSKALIEACASGRPIVTTDVPGCRDVVQDGVNGLLVPARNAPSLARALARLLTDPQLRTTMASHGRRRAEIEFGLDSVLDAHMQLYDELTEGAHGGVPLQ
jgi:glycosyltransferase involved in cell wall biosynthesis